MNSQIFEIDKQAEKDGDYSTHTRSLLELAELFETVVEPTPKLKGIMKEAYASLEGGFANSNTFAELRDILLSKPPNVAHEYMINSLKTYLKRKIADQTEESLVKMAEHLAPIVQVWVG